MISYNGVSSDLLGLKMPYGSNQWVGSLPSIALQQIPGTSGALIQSNDRFDNVEQTFNFIKLTSSPFDELIQLSASVSRWLFSSDPDYRKLIVDTQPDYFYLAVPTKVSEFAIQDKVGITFSITFSIKPFAYAVLGDNYQTVTGSLSLVSSSPRDALPLWHIKGTGNGSFDLNGVTFSFVDISSDLYVDSDSEEVYDGANDYVPQKAIFQNYEFPKLVSGMNTIDNLVNISLEVKPRWRFLI